MPPYGGGTEPCMENLRKRGFSLQLKPFLLAVIGTLLVGALSGFLTQNSKEVYENLILPVFAPPASVFGVVWIILYIMMGIALYFVLISPKSVQRREAVTAYIFQLIVNFFWSIIFFRFGNFLTAFWWIILLIILVAVTMYRFKKVNNISFYLLITYMVWILFAAALNLSIYLLNK